MSAAKNEIKKALELLSHISPADYEGLEAEFSITLAKLSNDYASHVKYSIACNHIENFISGNIPKCPSCNSMDNVYIAYPQVELLCFTPYLDRKNENVIFYTDITDTIYADSSKETEDPCDVKDHSKRRHMYCTECKTSFAENKFIKDAFNHAKRITFEEIAAWAKEYSSTPSCDDLI